MKYHLLYFGQAYGECQYGVSEYSDTGTTCGTTAPSKPSDSSASGTGLTNTGIAVASIVTLACLIVFVSLVVRIWRRKPTAPDVRAAGVGSVENHTNSKTLS